MEYVVHVQHADFVTIMFLDLMTHLFPYLQAVQIYVLL